MISAAEAIRDVQLSQESGFLAAMFRAHDDALHRGGYGDLYAGSMRIAAQIGHSTLREDAETCVGTGVRLLDKIADNKARNADRASEYYYYLAFSCAHAALCADESRYKPDSLTANLLSMIRRDIVAPMSKQLSVSQCWSYERRLTESVMPPLPGRVKRMLASIVTGCGYHSTVPAAIKDCV
jgi:hypothetical protein